MRWPDHSHRSQKKTVSAFVMHHRAQKFSPKEKKCPAYVLAAEKCCRLTAWFSMVTHPHSRRVCLVGASSEQLPDCRQASVPCQRSPGAYTRPPKDFRWIVTMYFFKRTMRVNSATFFRARVCRRHPPSTCAHRIVAATPLHRNAIACWYLSMRPPRAAARLLNRRLMHAKPIPFPC